MYTAYSNTKKKLVDVEDEFDLFEEFSCPNPQCTARFTIRSVTGKRAKHFAKLPSTDHIKNCPFANDKERYSNPSMIRALSLESIYENMRQVQRGNPQNGTHGKRRGAAQPQMLVINTPNKLLQYCLRNPLYQKYLPGIRIDDILLCSQNLIKYGRFKGIEGIRMIVGTTVRNWENNQLKLEIRKTTQTGKNIWLNVLVKSSVEICSNIRKHLATTYGEYPGQALAVFGYWSIDKPYNISCTVDCKSHIIVLKEEDKMLLSRESARN